MITINNWRDLDKYGFNLLTGEACALSYRGLFDLTAEALEIVRQVIGAVEITTPSDYNGGKAIGSLLMPYTMFEPLAVFCLFTRENVQHVCINHESNTYSGMSISGFMGDELESVREAMAASKIDNYRILTYPSQRSGVTQGMSNVHQMSGRIA